MKIKNYILNRIDKIEEEFERILENGFDKDSPFYLYLGDIRTAVKKIEQTGTSNME